jgi:hypothetical protein
MNDGHDGLRTSNLLDLFRSGSRSAYDAIRRSLTLNSTDHVASTLAGAWIRDGAGVPGGPHDLPLALGWLEQPSPSLFIEFGIGGDPGDFLGQYRDNRMRR